MAVTVNEIPVPFEAEDAGTGELTWGQLGIWRRTRRTGRTMNLVVHLPLDPYVPLAEMVGMLRFLVSRHPALRTRLRFDPDGSPHPRQVVAGAGEVPLRVVDLDEEDDLAAAVEEVRSRFELTFFDYEHEFPVRMAVFRRSGKSAHLVIGYSHILLDGAGIRALADDLEHFDRTGGSAGLATAPPAEAPSALDVARAQATPAGRRQSTRAVRYWAAQLDRLTDWPGSRPQAEWGHPLDRLAGSPDSERQPERGHPLDRLTGSPDSEPRPERGRPLDWLADVPGVEPEPPQEREPRHWELVGYSPALELGMRVVAARTGAGTTHVLLAAYAVAVGRVFGRDPAVAQIVVGNRFRPGFAESASQLSQHGICVVDVAGAPFDEVVARAQKAVTNASFAGYYDPVECDALLAQVTASRGRPPDIEWHLNDRRAKTGAGERAGLEPEARELSEVSELLPLSRWYWGRKVPVFDGALFVQVDSEPAVPERRLPEGTPPAVHLEIWTDTRVFAVAQIERFAHALEAVVVAAALDEEPARD